MNKSPLTDKVRFLQYVQKTRKCWFWTGGTYGNGYGQFWFRKRTVCAHRASFELFVGEIPVGLQVLHRCDNPSCVNPKHLFTGTQKDNVQDAVQKGHLKTGDAHWTRLEPSKVPRGETHYSVHSPEKVARGDNSGARRHPEKIPRGSAHWSTKLTESDVKEIRKTYLKAQGKQGTIKALALKFGICSDQVSNIIKRRSWAHVD